jgi:hypothetical protein
MENQQVTEPRAPSQEEWQAEAATGTLDMAEMDALIEENQRLWAAHDEINDKKKAAYELAEESDVKIMNALKAAGKSKYYVDGLGTAYLTTKSSVKVPGSIKEKVKFFDYLKQIGNDVFLSMATVNSSTLNSWYNAKMEEAAERAKEQGTVIQFEVPGIEAPTMRETLGFRAEKKGKT